MPIFDVYFSDGESLRDMRFQNKAWATVKDALPVYKRMARERNLRWFEVREPDWRWRPKLKYGGSEELAKALKFQPEIVLGRWERINGKYTKVVKKKTAAKTNGFGLDWNMKG